MPRLPIVTIIGAGRIGRTLGDLMTTSGTATCRWWDARPELCEPKDLSLSNGIQDANLVLLAVPTMAFAELLPTLKLLQTSTVLVTISKGAPDEKNISPAEFFSEHLPEQPLVVLGGPMMAEEMSAEQPGQAVIASTSVSAQQTVANLLQHAHLNCTRSDKPIDVSRSGVLKNVYAATIGMIDGSDLPNEIHRRGHELVREEFFRAGQVLKIDQDVLAGPAGLGDFLTTIHSPHSRNRRSGEELIRHGVYDRTAEAMHSMHVIVAAVKTEKNLPLLRAASGIIAGTSPSTIFHQLITSI